MKQNDFLWLLRFVPSPFIFVFPKQVVVIPGTRKYCFLAYHLPRNAISEVQHFLLLISPAGMPEFALRFFITKFNSK